jgi:stage II sporulation protein AA (anti-sigma F factor antagonist)
MTTKPGTHWLEREDKGAITLVRLKTPEVPDEDIVRTVFDLIFKLITEANRLQIILNLATVDLFPSLGLGKLVMLNRKLQSIGGRLALCNLSTSLQENLERTRLSELFAIFPTEAEALQSFT